MQTAASQRIDCPPVTPACKKAPADRDLRNALGAFATGVTVVTAVSPEGQPLGATVNSFTSVSLNPPLVLFCLSRESRCAQIALAEHFTIHVLAAGQHEISNHFAKRSAERWRDERIERHANGCPVVPDALAVFECRRHRVHDGGDHLIVVGEIRNYRYSADQAPLVYLRGTYRFLQGTDR
jgi:flavin reductase (DIM6/NTAB) family NADH-FMN oxidoreductase RutF